MNEYDDHKTFIPGVGLLVTSWDGSESFIVPIEELGTEKPKTEEKPQPKKRGDFCR